MSVTDPFNVAWILAWERLPRWARFVTSLPVMGLGVAICFGVLPLGVLIAAVGFMMLVHSLLAPTRQGPRDWPEL